MTVAQSASAESATKRCTKCGEVKVLDEFRLEKRMRDGRSSWCKDCKRAHGRTSAARKWAEDADYRTRKAAYEKERRDTDAEREKAARYVRERRAKDEEFRLALAERARNTPREVARVYEEAYRERKRTDEQFDAFMERILREEEEMGNVNGQ